jgi:hypothetical protein
VKRSQLFGMGRHRVEAAGSGSRRSPKLALPGLLMPSASSIVQHFQNLVRIGLGPPKAELHDPAVNCWPQILAAPAVYAAAMRLGFDGWWGTTRTGIGAGIHGYFGSLSRPITENFARLITPGGQIRIRKTPRNPGYGAWIITRLLNRIPSFRPECRALHLQKPWDRSFRSQGFFREVGPAIVASVIGATAIGSIRQQPVRCGIALAAIRQNPVRGMANCSRWPISNSRHAARSCGDPRCASRNHGWPRDFSWDFSPGNSLAPDNFRVLR